MFYDENDEFPEIHSAVLVENQTEQDLSSISVERCQDSNSFSASMVSAEIGSIEISGTEVSDSDDIPKEYFTALEAVNMSHENWDMRPHLFDKNSGDHLLLDSGAAVSCCPPEPGDTIDPSISLKAVNGAKLKCYGKKSLNT